MDNFIILMILLAVLGMSVSTLRKEKKKGTCIGCPAGGCASCKGCGHHKAVETIESGNEKCKTSLSSLS